jgi:hypothetical protein
VKLFGSMGKAFSAAASPERGRLACATDEAGFVVVGGVGRGCFRFLNQSQKPMGHARSSACRVYHRDEDTQEGDGSNGDSRS